MERTTKKTEYQRELRNYYRLLRQFSKEGTLPKNFDSKVDSFLSELRTLTPCGSPMKRAA